MGALSFKCQTRDVTSRPHPFPLNLGQRLVEAALARGSGDNITCIVAMLGLGEESMHEVAYSRGAHKYAGGGLGAPAP